MGDSSGMRMETRSNSKQVYEKEVSDEPEDPNQAQALAILSSGLLFFENMSLYRNTEQTPIYFVISKLSGAPDFRHVSALDETVACQGTILPIATKFSSFLLPAFRKWLLHSGEVLSLFSFLLFVREDEWN